MMDYEKQVDSYFRQTAMNEAAASRIKPHREPGLLDEVLVKVQGMSEYAARIAEKLGDHADRLHGANIASGVGNAETKQVSSGILGDIMDSLERLSANLDNLQKQAERNCNLA